MQCQSCGSDVKKMMKRCPSCGEEMTSPLTSSLPAAPRQTGSLDSGFIRAELPSMPLPARNPGEGRYQNEVKLNGRALDSVELPPLPPTISAQLPNPPLPVTEAPLPLPDINKTAQPPMLPVADNGRTRETMPPTDVIRGGILCRRCQHELKAGAKFCSTCGTSIEPSIFAKALDAAQAGAQIAFARMQKGVKSSPLPLASLVLLGVAGLFVVIAFVQYLIPAGIDERSSSQVIYHLRSIEFLLVALVAVVASLVVGRR